jgi:hypothetical protein
MPSPYVPARRRVGGLMQSRDTKALERHLRSLEAGAGLELATVRVAETVAVAKIEAIEATGHVGVSAASSLARRVRYEAECDPYAAQSVAYVADGVVQEIRSQVEDLGRRLRS